jgi:hypothetical protein
LPRRQFPIAELRRVLTQPSTRGELHDRVIGLALGHMRQQRATWMVVLGGLVLPGLRCRAEHLRVCDDQRCVELRVIARQMPQPLDA